MGGGGYNIFWIKNSYKLPSLRSVVRNLVAEPCRLTVNATKKITFSHPESSSETWETIQGTHRSTSSSSDEVLNKILDWEGGEFITQNLSLRERGVSYPTKRVFVRRKILDSNGRKKGGYGLVTGRVSKSTFIIRIFFQSKIISMLYVQRKKNLRLT